MLRRSESCAADYCENCDRWHGDPRIVPLHLGPTWERDTFGRFIAPEFSLAPDLMAWAKRWLTHPDGAPWTFTKEQVRLLHWIYAVDERGRFVYRELNVQRLKGWG